MIYKGISINRTPKNTLANRVGFKYSFFNQKVNLMYDFLTIDECKEYIDYLEKVDLL